MASQQQDSQRSHTTFEELNSSHSKEPKDLTTKFPVLKRIGHKPRRILTAAATYFAQKKLSVPKFVTRVLCVVPLLTVSYPFIRRKTKKLQAAYSKDDGQGRNSSQPSERVKDESLQKQKINENIQDKFCAINGVDKKVCAGFVACKLRSEGQKAFCTTQNGNNFTENTDDATMSLTRGTADGCESEVSLVSEGIGEEFVHFTEPGVNDDHDFDLAKVREEQTPVEVVEEDEQAIANQDSNNADGKVTKEATSTFSEKNNKTKAYEQEDVHQDISLDKPTEQNTVKMPETTVGMEEEGQNHANEGLDVNNKVKHKQTINQSKNNAVTNSIVQASQEQGLQPDDSDMKQEGIQWNSNPDLQETETNVACKLNKDKQSQDSKVSEYCKQENVNQELNLDESNFKREHKTIGHRTPLSETEIQEVCKQNISHIDKATPGATSAQNLATSSDENLQPIPCSFETGTSTESNGSPVVNMPQEKAEQQKCKSSNITQYTEVEHIENKDCDPVGKENQSSSQLKDNSQGVDSKDRDMQSSESSEKSDCEHCKNGEHHNLKICPAHQQKSPADTKPMKESSNSSGKFKLIDDTDNTSCHEDHEEKTFTCGLQENPSASMEDQESGYYSNPMGSLKSAGIQTEAATTDSYPTNLKLSVPTTEDCQSITETSTQDLSLREPVQERTEVPHMDHYFSEQDIGYTNDAKHLIPPNENTVSPVNPESCTTVQEREISLCIPPTSDVQENCISTMIAESDESVQTERPKLPLLDAEHLRDTNKKFSATTSEPAQETEKMGSKVNIVTGKEQSQIQHETGVCRPGEEPSSSSQSEPIDFKDRATTEHSPSDISRNTPSQDKRNTSCQDTLEEALPPIHDSSSQNTGVFVVVKSLVHTVKVFHIPQAPEKGEEPILSDSNRWYLFKNTTDTKEIHSSGDVSTKDEFFEFIADKNVLLSPNTQAWNNNFQNSAEQQTQSAEFHHGSQLRPASRRNLYTGKSKETQNEIVLYNTMPASDGSNHSIHTTVSHRSSAALEQFTMRCTTEETPLMEGSTGPQNTIKIKHSETSWEPGTSFVHDNWEDQATFDSVIDHSSPSTDLQEEQAINHLETSEESLSQDENPTKCSNTHSKSQATSKTTNQGSNLRKSQRYTQNHGLMESNDESHDVTQSCALAQSENETEHMYQRQSASDTSYNNNNHTAISQLQEHPKKKTSEGTNLSSPLQKPSSDAESEMAKTTGDHKQPITGDSHYSNLHGRQEPSQHQKSMIREDKKTPSSQDNETQPENGTTKPEPPNCKMETNRKSTHLQQNKGEAQSEEDALQSKSPNLDDIQESGTSPSYHSTEQLMLGDSHYYNLYGRQEPSQHQNSMIREDKKTPSAQENNETQPENGKTKPGPPDCKLETNMKSTHLQQKGEAQSEEDALQSKSLNSDDIQESGTSPSYHSTEQLQDNTQLTNLQTTESTSKPTSSQNAAFKKITPQPTHKMTNDADSSVQDKTKQMHQINGKENQQLSSDVPIDEAPEYGETQNASSTAHTVQSKPIQGTRRKVKEKSHQSSTPQTSQTYMQNKGLMVSNDVSQYSLLAQSANDTEHIYQSQSTLNTSHHYSNLTVTPQLQEHPEKMMSNGTNLSSLQVTSCDAESEMENKTGGQGKLILGDVHHCNLHGRQELSQHQNSMIREDKKTPSPQDNETQPENCTTKPEPPDCKMETNMKSTHLQQNKDKALSEEDDDAQSKSPKTDSQTQSITLSLANSDDILESGSYQSHHPTEQLQHNSQLTNLQTTESASKQASSENAPFNNKKLQPTHIKMTNDADSSVQDKTTKVHQINVKENQLPSSDEAHKYEETQNPNSSANKVQSKPDQGAQRKVKDSSKQSSPLQTGQDNSQFPNLQNTESTSKPASSQNAALRKITLQPTHKITNDADSSVQDKSTKAHNEDWKENHPLSSDVPSDEAPKYIETQNPSGTAKKVQSKPFQGPQSKVKENSQQSSSLQLQEHPEKKMSSGTNLSSPLQKTSRDAEPEMENMAGEQGQLILGDSHHCNLQGGHNPSQHQNSMISEDKKTPSPQEKDETHPENDSTKPEPPDCKMEINMKSTRLQLNKSEPQSEADAQSTSSKTDSQTQNSPSLANSDDILESGSFQLHHSTEQLQDNNQLTNLQTTESTSKLASSQTAAFKKITLQPTHKMTNDAESSVPDKTTKAHQIYRKDNQSIFSDVLIDEVPKYGEIQNSSGTTNTVQSKPVQGARRKVKENSQQNRQPSASLQNPLQDSGHESSSKSQHWPQNPMWSSQNHANPQLERLAPQTCKRRKVDKGYEHDTHNPEDVKSENRKGSRTLHRGHKSSITCRNNLPNSPQPVKTNKKNDRQQEIVQNYLDDFAIVCVPRTQEDISHPLLQPDAEPIIPYHNQLLGNEGQEQRARHCIQRSQRVRRDAMQNCRPPPRPYYNQANVQAHGALPDVVQETMPRQPGSDTQSEPDVTSQTSSRPSNLDH